jgi:hypothetical protein
LKFSELPKFWGQFFCLKEICIEIDKNALGFILGEFFANSSGHSFVRSSTKGGEIKMLLGSSRYVCGMQSA